MTRGRVSVARVYGIPISVHPSWLLVFGLVTWSLADGYLPANHPAASPAGYWAVAAAASLLFFASIVVHELLFGSLTLLARDVPLMAAALGWPHETLERLVNTEILGAGRRCFPVSDDGRLLGLLTVHEVKKIPRDRWPHKTAGDVMTSLETLITIGPEADLLDARWRRWTTRASRSYR